MKILATSDWHLGHNLYNDSQEDAQRDMLRQMTDIVSEHKPDVLVISGDVYDTTQPSATVQQMFADAIVKMHDAHNDMTIVCIAGNHDSGSKHMIFHTPWQALNVHMIGNIVKDSNLDDYIIEVPGKGYVVAVPFAADRYMPDDVFCALSAQVSERNAAGLPVVLATHTAVARADSRGHEFSTDTNIGGLNCQELSIFGDGYDFVALGHIHKQQQLDKESRVWYSGTPIAVSFDESYAGNNHGVLMVECDKHGAPVTVTPITIENIHPLVNLPYEGFSDWDTAKKMLNEYDNDIPSFIRLNVEVKDYLPAGANDEAQHIVDGKACRLSLINSRRKQDENNKTTEKKLTTSELKTTDIIDVAELHLKSLGIEMDDDLKSMLQEVKELLNTNNE